MNARVAYGLLGLTLVLFIVGAWYAQKSTQPRDTAPQSHAAGTIIPHATTTMTFSLTSPAFAEGASIPAKYTCDGAGVSVPLAIANAPAGTKTFTLIVDDPDVPKALSASGLYVHWVLFNIPSTATTIEEGAMPGMLGANSSGKSLYTGPCPPKQYEPSEHRYIFTLYALDSALPLSVGASKDDVEHAMQGHVIATAQLIGKYRRP